MYKKKLIALAALVFIVLGVYFNARLFSPVKSLNTYFHYSDGEAAPLRGLSSRFQMESSDIFRWDTIAFDLISNVTTLTSFDPNATKIYAYIAVAQRDAAFLSFNSKQKFEGSFDPVMSGVLCIFFASECPRVSAGMKTDAYSEKLAETVIAKIKGRIEEDKALTKAYERKEGTEYWSGPEPFVGIADGSSKTWLIESGSQFRVPPPPLFDSLEFKNQIELVKKAREEATDAEKQATVFWAGGPGTKTAPGIWLDIADAYMESNKIPLEKVLRAHSLLALTIADVNIAVFDSKYTYWVKRPFMLIPNFTTIMPTPNHPSYPAGHSGLSAAASVILSHYFPEAKEQWKKRGDEGGLSRVWGGIHFPMDNEASRVLGEQIAKTAIEKLP